jgi:hypothetical protein
MPERCTLIVVARFHHLGNPAPTCPAVPIHEHSIGIVERQQGREDFTQRLFDLFPPDFNDSLVG